MAEFVAQSDGRLRGVAGADLTRPVQTVRELRRTVEELGFVALRIVPWLWQLPPTDRLYYPLYAACVDLGIPFCTQVGHTGPLRPSETGRPIPYIDQVALDFPELTIVCGRIGYPWTTEMIAVADKHANVCIDTSAYTARRYPRELVDYLRGRGRNKALGTNYPMITPRQALEHLGELDLDEEATELFLSGNARRIFSL
ncbi:amidohydrolase family protein [Streptomyces sp. NPDC101455]|uniref:amidohydrolase family protein n=1 Tax=Streptomyces sp. NPDC101455 TaxID=3366142 RepID=UPI003803D438